MKASEYSSKAQPTQHPGILYERAGLGYTPKCSACKISFSSVFAYTCILSYMIWYWQDQVIK